MRRPMRLGFERFLSEITPVPHATSRHAQGPRVFFAHAEHLPAPPLPGFPAEPFRARAYTRVYTRARVMRVRVESRISFSCSEVAYGSFRPPCLDQAP